MASSLVSFPARLAQHAQRTPREVAVVYRHGDDEPLTLTWADLDGARRRVAGLLRELGVGADSRVVIALENSPEHLAAALGAWSLGACVVPTDPAMPPLEREAFMGLIDPTICVADWDRSRWPCVPANALPGAGTRAWAGDPVVATPGKAIGSGGSTGRPKLIVDPAPWARVPGDAAGPGGHALRFQPAQVQLVAGPLSHNAPFSWAHFGLFEGHRLVLHDRFDAETVLDSLERYGVSWCFFVPTMLHRLLRVPGVEDVDFARLEVLWHAAAACPRWLKRRWIDLLGPERVLEAFGGTESVGLTVIDGVEWSRREGSVGRAVASLLRVRNENGSLCAPAEVGEIFMRPTEPIFGGPPADVPFEYVGGSPVRRDVEGFYSLGDLGFLDENGFLFPVERRADLVITGGENVYPAEVEGVLLEHPLVQDVAVIGLPDEDLGRRVHAVVAVASPGSRGDHLETLLRDFALERLSRSKVPRSFEIVESLPRDGAGKLRRSALVAERTHDVLARRD